MNRRRPLLLLTLCVMAVHVWLLAGQTSNEVRPAPAVTQAFSTRTLPLPAPKPAVQTVNTAVSAPEKVRSVSPPKAPVPRKSAPLHKPKASPAPVPGDAAPPSPVATPKLQAPTAAPTVWHMPSEAELLALGAGDTAPATDAQSSPSLRDSADAHASATGDSEAHGRLPHAQEAGDPTPAGPAVEATKTTASAQPLAAAPAQVPPASEAPPTPASAPTELVPVKLPPSRELDFTVSGKAKGFGYSALATLRWEHDLTTYRAHQEVKVMFLGSRSQTSEGRITEWGLQPRRFGDRARSERAAHFDFAQGRVTFSANAPAAAIAPGAQDRLSVFLQLAGMLAAAPERYPSGSAITMTTVSARSADEWTFTVQGNETLELPIGTLDTVQLQRMPRREYDQKAQVWLAPSLGYLPARIRITEANGDFVELNLRSEEPP